MVNPVSSANVSHASVAAKPAAPKPQQAQQRNPQASDKVTLKSRGGASQDGDGN